MHYTEIRVFFNVFIQPLATAHNKNVTLSSS